MKYSKGFSIIEGLVLAGVVLLIVGVGYVGWKAFTKSSETAQTSSVTTGQTAEVITTKADLEAAEKALGELDFEDDAALEAETQANL